MGRNNNTSLRTARKKFLAKQSRTINIAVTARSIRPRTVWRLQFPWVGGHLGWSAIIPSSECWIISYCVHIE
jgi:hypothetical protein